MSFKNLDTLFLEYGTSHRHPTNILIHMICVPLITLSVLGTLWCGSVLLALPIYLNGGTWAVFLGLMFYWHFVWRDRRALSMVVVISIFIGILCLCAGGVVVFFGDVEALWIFVGIFLFSWVGQFWGHHVEGRRPSFLTDLKFLLIGPAWVVAKQVRR